MKMCEYTRINALQRCVVENIVRVRECVNIRWDSRVDVQ